MVEKNPLQCSTKSCVSTTVMGERGQVVIPKEVRDTFSLKTGDRFLVIAHNGQAIGLIPLHLAKKQFAALHKKIALVLKNIDE